MICKCPECQEFASIVTDSVLKRMSIAGNQVIKDTQRQGTKVSESVTKHARKYLGDFLGEEIIGNTSEFLTDTASTVIGYGLGTIKGASQVLDKNHAIAVCPNNHETLIKLNEVADVSDRFFRARKQDILDKQGVKYIVINPQASIAYPKESKLYVLREAPNCFIFPEGKIQPGEVYCNHPANPMEFFPLETYRFNVLKEELLDLASFLTSLGAKEIHVANKSDISQRERHSGSTNINSETKIGDRSLDVDYSNDYDSNNYSRLVDIFEHEAQSERKDHLEANETLYQKWAPIRAQWRTLREERRNGALKCKITVSNSSMTSAYKSELDTISAQYSQLGGSEKVSCASEAISKMMENKDVSYVIEVIFYPERISLFQRIINYIKNLF